MYDAAIAMGGSNASAAPHKSTVHWVFKHATMPVFLARECRLVVLPGQSILHWPNPPSAHRLRIGLIKRTGPQNSPPARLHASVARTACRGEPRDGASVPVVEGKENAVQQPLGSSERHADASAGIDKKRARRVPRGSVADFAARAARPSPPREELSGDALRPSMQQAPMYSPSEKSILQWLDSAILVSQPGPLLSAS